jgi:putative transposase
LKPVDRKPYADYLIEQHQMSVRQACKALRLHRSLFYYQKTPDKDEGVVRVLVEFADRHPTYGFWKIYKTIRRRGIAWNHKRVYRVYTMLKMNLKRKMKRRLPERVKHPLEVPKCKNQIWSIDFMSDSLRDGRKFRVLNIIDDYNREALAMVADISLTSLRLTMVLDELIKEYGKPEQIRTDNGPEFISQTLANWCNKNNIEHKFIQPGKPMQNAFIERFNGSVRRELLDAYIFNSLTEIRLMLNEWMLHYNTERPHDSLNDLTPKDFLEKQIKESNFILS